jgi:tetratricopeptide (TPR) repeat protein
VLDREPTAEFQAKCLDVAYQWEGGKMPYPEARQALSVLAQDAFQRGHLADQGRVEQVIGYMEVVRGNLNISIHHFERARAAYSQVKNTVRAAICDMNIGESYRNKGDFKRALALYGKAYEAFKAENDIENQAFALSNRGQAWLSMGRLDTAQTDLVDGLSLAEQIPVGVDDRTILLCEVNLALTRLYILRERYEMAWEAAIRAYEVAEGAPQAFEKGYANRALAEVISVSGVPSLEKRFENDANVYFQAANDAFLGIHAEGEIARTMFAHALSLVRNGRRMAAARKLQLAMIIFTRLGMVDDAARAAETQLEVL